MKLSKLLLTSTTALGLSMTAAMADDNEAYIDQLGNDNNALVEQEGSSAEAGSDGSGNTPGGMVQNGDNNNIDILQLNGSVVGTGGDYVQLNEGVDQDGDYNTLNVTQEFGSRVFEVQQDSRGTTGAPTDVVNSVEIDQKGNMAVSRVNQTYTGDGTSGTANTVNISQRGSQFHLSRVGDSNGFSKEALENSDRGIFQVGDSNSVDITQRSAGQSIERLNQTGSGNDFDLVQTDGNGNDTDFAIQTGNDNVIDIQQLGANNEIRVVKQIDSSDGSGDNNSLVVTMNGDNNGVGIGLGSSGDAFDVAGLVDTTAGYFTQDGDSNIATLDVWGSDNAVSYHSEGDSNSIDGDIGSGTVNASGNRAAVVQVGDMNTASFSQMGSGNNAGISQ